MKNYTTIAMDLQSIPASDFHIPYPLANSTTIDDPVPHIVDTVPDLTPLVFLQLLIYSQGLHRTYNWDYYNYWVVLRESENQK